MSSHTRGPWIKGDDQSEWIGIYSEDEAKLIAEVRSEDTTWAEALANANLIVSAPDLLAAMKALLPLVDQDSAGAEEIVRAADAAIAKAEGRE